jgi:hypothetical protein
MDDGLRERQYFETLVHLRPDAMAFAIIRERSPVSIPAITELFGYTQERSARK